MNISNNFYADTCSLINMFNGGIFPKLPYIFENPIIIVKSVKDEVGGEYEAVLDYTMAREGCVPCGVVVSAIAVSNLVSLENLGAGEAHAILSCVATGGCLVCDDKHARNVAKRMLGECRVIGTIGLICALLAKAVYNVEHAIGAVDRMVRAGAFLPYPERSYWEDCIAGNARLK